VLSLQAVDERLFDLDPGDPGRSDDGFAALLARDARGQIHAGIDLFHQTGDQRATSQKFGAHRDRDIDPEFIAVRAFDQQSGKGLGLVAAGIILIPKQLLELVDEEEQVAPARQMPGATPFDDRAGPVREECPQQLDVGNGVHALRLLRLQQRFGQVPQRRAFRPHLGDQPARACLRHETELERVEQSRLDQGRLAGSRGADDRQEPGLRQSTNHVVDAVVAPEKQMGFGAPKRPQPRIGRTRGTVGDHVRSSATICCSRSTVASC